MRDYFYEMIEKAKTEFQVDFKEEDIKRVEDTIFNGDLSEEQIKERIDSAYLRVKENYEMKKKDELIKEGTITANTEQVKETAKTIFSDPYLAEHLSIYGGSIPYLLTGKESKRIIGDIDTHIDLEKMQELREYIHENSDIITVLYDSLELSGEDYGMELIINDLNVSIFPTIATKEGMAIRNFYIREMTDEIEVTETLFPRIIEKDEIKTYDVDGVQMRMMSPEFTYLTKKVANRPKDIEDNKIIEKIVNYEDIERMKNIMKTPIVTEKKYFPFKNNQEK